MQDAPHRCVDEAPMAPMPKRGRDEPEDVEQDDGGMNREHDKGEHQASHRVTGASMRSSDRRGFAVGIAPASQIYDARRRSDQNAHQTPSRQSPPAALFEIVCAGKGSSIGLDERHSGGGHVFPRHFEPGLVAIIGVVDVIAFPTGYDIHEQGQRGGAVGRGDRLQRS